MRPLLLAAAILAAAALTPALHSKDQDPFAFTKIDLKLLEESEAFDRQLDSRALIYHDPVLEKHLAGIAAPLLPAAPLEKVQWRFRILRDPFVNAFALPNGTVYVFSGLLARIENDDQLAAVLAHEATHVTNRHAYVFNRSLRKKVLASELISMAATWTPFGGWYAAIGANVSQFAIVALVYGYSRELESEADRSAIDRLRHAGRDPAQFVRAFAIMDDRLEPEPVPFLFKDHATTKDRIADLKKILGFSGDAPAGADGGYLQRARSVILQDIQLDLDSRRFRSAVAAAGRLVAADPRDAVSLYWLAESYRSLGPRRPRLTPEEQTNSALRSGYRQQQRRTEAEDAKALAATPEGKEALDANQRKAGELFRKALDLDPSLALPHLGLGSLYEQQAKWEDALAAYRQCAALTGQPAAKARAERRIEEASKRAAAAKEPSK